MKSMIRRCRKSSVEMLRIIVDLGDDFCLNVERGGYTILKSIFFISDRY